MQWKNTETPTFAATPESDGSAAVAETMALLDADGVQVAAITKSATGAVSLAVSGTLQADGTAKIAGTLTGTADGTMEDVADIALSTANTYTDAAVNTAVNAAILEINLQLKELQTKVNELFPD